MLEDLRSREAEHRMALPPLLDCQQVPYFPQIVPWFSTFVPMPPKVPNSRYHGYQEVKINLEAQRGLRQEADGKRK